MGGNQCNVRTDQIEAYYADDEPDYGDDEAIHGDDDAIHGDDETIHGDEEENNSASFAKEKVHRTGICFFSPSNIYHTNICWEMLCIAPRSNFQKPKTWGNVWIFT